MIARVGGDLLRASQDFSKQVRRTWPPRVPNSTCTAMTMPHKAGRPTTPADVAGRLDVMATADQTLTDELDRVDAARRRVCQATVQRLEHLLVTVCAGADAREELDTLDTNLLRDGAVLWTQRRRAQSPPSAADAGQHLTVIDGAARAAVSA